MPFPDQDQLRRFELTHGQLLDGANARYTNLRWFLNDEEIGFGDLSEENIGMIAKKLREGDEFVGIWCDGTLPQGLRDVPMVKIWPNYVMLREDIVAAG